MVGAELRGINDPIEEIEESSMLDDVRKLDLDEMTIFVCDDHEHADRARQVIANMQFYRGNGRKYRTLQTDMEGNKGVKNAPTKLYVVRVK